MNCFINLIRFLKAIQLNHLIPKQRFEDFTIWYHTITKPFGRNISTLLTKHDIRNLSNSSNTIWFTIQQKRCQFWQLSIRSLQILSKCIPPSKIRPFQIFSKSFYYKSSNSHTRKMQKKISKSIRKPTYLYVCRWTTTIQSPHSSWNETVAPFLPDIDIHVYGTKIDA